MTPREIICDNIGMDGTLEAADSIIAALQAEGYQIMQSVAYPHNVNAEYTVHSAGQQTVMRS